MSSETAHRAAVGGRWKGVGSVSNASRRGWFRDVGTLMTGTVGGQLLAVAVLPITTALFDPSELGTFAVFLAAVTIGYAVAALRFDAAIPVPDGDDAAAALTVISLRAAAAIGGVVAAIGAVFGPILGDLLGIGGVASWMWLIGPTIFAASSFQTLITWNTRIGAFGVISFARLVQGVGLAAGQIVAGLMGAGAVGLLFVPIIAWGIASSFLAVRLGLAGGLPARAPSLRAVAVRYRRFPLFMSWSVIANRISTEIAPAAMAAIHDPRTAGLFLLASRITYRPVGMVTQSMAQVYVNRAAPAWVDDPGALRRMIVGIGRKLLLVALVPTIVGLLFAPTVFAFVLGDTWREAGEYARFLIPMALGGLVSVSFGPTFAITERQHLQLYHELARLVVVLGSFGIAIVTDASPAATVGLYAVAATVGYLMLLAMIWKAADPAPSGAAATAPASIDAGSTALGRAAAI